MSEKAPRLTFIEYGICLAFIASTRATCRRRMVGCVLFDRYKRVVRTGYNGAPAGAPQCDEIGHLMVDGHCVRTTHSEKNAVLFVGNLDLTDGYCFITTRPCLDCLKVVINEGIKKIYYLSDYREKDNKDEIDKLCAKKDILLEKVNFDITEILQKSLNFHQDSGGILTSKYTLKIEEQFPEGSE